MPRQFHIKDMVIRKNIGTICMEVYHEDFDFDDESQGQMMRGMFKALGSDIPATPEHEKIRFDDESHQIFRVSCKWHDPSTGEEHSTSFLESDLEFCSKERPWKTIEGFNKTN